MKSFLQIFRAERFTRIPVYEDDSDNMVGVINIKDLLLVHPSREFHIRDIMREPYFTYEYKKTSELMVEMRKDSVNFTIVLDEYGATGGNDHPGRSSEEIVGDIRDEYDHDEEDPIRRIQDNEYQVLGSAKLDDLIVTWISIWNQRITIPSAAISLSIWIISQKPGNLLSQKTGSGWWSISSPENELTESIFIFRQRRKTKNRKKIISRQKILQSTSHVRLQDFFILLHRSHHRPYEEYLSSLPSAYPDKQRVPPQKPYVPDLLPDYERLRSDD